MTIVFAAVGTIYQAGYAVGSDGVNGISPLAHGRPALALARRAARPAALGMGAGPALERDRRPDAAAPRPDAGHRATDLRRHRDHRRRGRRLRPPARRRRRRRRRDLRLRRRAGRGRPRARGARRRAPAARAEADRGGRPRPAHRRPQPPPARRGARPPARPRAARAETPSRCSRSTSTTSSRPTIASGTRPATSSSSRSPPCFARELRQTDFVCRPGGDEFLVLLADTDAGAAQIVALKLLVAIRDVRLRQPGGEVISTRASIGISSVSRGECQPQELLAAADRALYAAKEQGGDRFAADLDLAAART